MNPLLIDEDGTVIAGHGRLAAASILKFAHVPTIEVRGLSDTEKRQLTLADNRIAPSAEWDRELLAVELSEILVEGGDIELMGFEVTEVDQILLDHETSASAPEDQLPDDASVPAISQPGDLWLFGDHRLLCGDVLKPANADVLCRKNKVDLVFTDPPYNLSISSLVGRGKKKYREFSMAFGEMFSSEF